MCVFDFKLARYGICTAQSTVLYSVPAWYLQPAPSSRAHPANPEGMPSMVAQRRAPWLKHPRLDQLDRMHDRPIRRTPPSANGVKRERERALARVQMCLVATKSQRTASSGSLPPMCCFITRQQAGLGRQCNAAVAVTKLMQRRSTKKVLRIDPADKHLGCKSSEPWAAFSQHQTK